MVMAMTDITFAYSWFGDFLDFRRASESWCKTYCGHLKSLNKYCLDNYPDLSNLTQNIINEWCKQRGKEGAKTWIIRLSFVRALLNYGNSRGYTNIELPELPLVDKVHYIPHAFTEDELVNLFYACDSVEIVYNRNDTKMRKIMMPVLFRLLYSTGMRPIEVVNLQRCDFDFETGVVSIRKSKGHNQRFIVLHDTMLELVKQYDIEIEKYYPSRIYFFPKSNNTNFKSVWITVNFKKLWYKYNTSYARAYDLRHNYAIENIMSWTNAGIEFNSKILALSKSMGHSSIQKTMYYFSIVPALYDKLEELTGKSFDELIPEVLDDEDE